MAGMDAVCCVLGGEWDGSTSVVRGILSHRFVVVSSYLLVPAARCSSSAFSLLYMLGSRC